MRLDIVVWGAVASTLCCYSASGGDGARDADTTETADEWTGDARDDVDTGLDDGGADDAGDADWTDDAPDDLADGDGDETDDVGEAEDGDDADAPCVPGPELCDGVDNDCDG